MEMVAVVDYGMGNLRSVYNAIDLLGFEATIINSPEKLSNFDRVILPGVGSYGVCVQNLNSSGFSQAIKEFVDTGKPLMGICLGMQVLSDKGLEGGEFLGLGLVEGEVVRLELTDQNLKIPHVGWNAVNFTDPGHPLAKGLKQDSTFYFTHSYYFNTIKDKNIFGVTSYGKDFVSAIIRENVFATQFHPEKSQDSGLTLLKNFLSWKI
jgi:glutamine amidotransferase